MLKNQEIFTNRFRMTPNSTIEKLRQMFRNSIFKSCDIVFERKQIELTHVRHVVPTSISIFRLTKAENVANISTRNYFTAENKYPIAHALNSSLSKNFDSVENFRLVENRLKTSIYGIPLEISIYKNLSKSIVTKHVSYLMLS